MRAWTNEAFDKVIYILVALNNGESNVFPKSAQINA